MKVDEEAYRQEFEGESLGEKTKHAAALEHARDNRKFEIDLYWKRASYFWGLITATFAGYFAIISSSTAKSERDFLAFVLACIGCVLTFAWFMADKGSKQWQSNWEAHVDLLENKVTGPLYKTVLRPHGENIIKKALTGPAKYSVSRVNQLVNVFILMIWVLLALHAAWPVDFIKNEQLGKIVAHKYAIFGVLAAVFTALILWLGRTGDGNQVHEGNKRESNILDWRRDARGSLARRVDAAMHCDDRGALPPNRVSESPPDW